MIVALTLGPLTAPAEAACLSQRESRHVVKSGQAVRASIALRRAGIRPRDAVSIELCESGRGYVYEVSVLESSGELSRLTIPAN